MRRISIIALYAFTLASWLDWFSTIFALRRPGAYETNPVLVLVMTALGPWGLLLISVLIPVGIIYFLLVKYDDDDLAHLVGVMALVRALVAVGNMVIASTA